MLTICWSFWAFVRQSPLTSRLLLAFSGSLASLRLFWGRPRAPPRHSLRSWSWSCWVELLAVFSSGRAKSPHLSFLPTWNGHFPCTKFYPLSRILSLSHRLLLLQKLLQCRILSQSWRSRGFLLSYTCHLELSSWPQSFWSAVFCAKWISAPRNDPLTDYLGVILCLQSDLTSGVAIRPRVFLSFHLPYAWLLSSRHCLSNFAFSSAYCHELCSTLVLHCTQTYCPFLDLNLRLRKPIYRSYFDGRIASGLCWLNFFQLYYFCFGPPWLLKSYWMKSLNVVLDALA